MPYALTMILHERLRYLPGVLAVAFSALLVAMQVGLLLGIFSVVSIPIDRSGADVWVGYPGVPSVGTTLSIPAGWEARVANQPGVERVETYVRGLAFVAKRGGGVEMCQVIGTRLDAGALGAIRELTPELRRLLREPGSLVVDEEELADLGVQRVGEFVEVNGRRLRVVGTVRTLKAFAGTYLFCSLATAREALRLRGGETVYLLARCRDPGDAERVVRQLRAHGNLSAFTSAEFSTRSRLHWLVKTNAGVALGFAALLGLLVGASVTSQTLYAATAAALRQYAVLEALGVPTRQMAAMVLVQAFWVGLLGSALALPAALALAPVVEALGGRILLPPWLLAAAATLTLATALVSGLVALRSLRWAEPAVLLR